MDSRRKKGKEEARYFFFPPLPSPTSFFCSSPPPEHLRMLNCLLIRTVFLHTLACHPSPPPSPRRNWKWAEPITPQPKKKKVEWPKKVRLSLELCCHWWIRGGGGVRGVTRPDIRSSMEASWRLRNLLGLGGRAFTKLALKVITISRRVSSLQ